jgi:hypothetical protein
MHHEIVGPEMTVTTGQLRLPKEAAIARHVAQYETRSMGVDPVWREQESRLDTENRKKAARIKINLEALSLADRDLGRHAIEAQLEALGIPSALAGNWVERNQIVRFKKLKKEAQVQDISISILSLENRDIDKLKNEMEGMLKVLKLSETVRQVIRDIE